MNLREVFIHILPLKKSIQFIINLKNKQNFKKGNLIIYIEQIIDFNNFFYNSKIFLY